MVKIEDTVLYATGMDVEVTTIENSVMHNAGEEITTIRSSVMRAMGNKDENGYPIYKYKENGVAIAKGEDPLCVAENYLKTHLGYDFTNFDERYEWRDYVKNTNYEVSELGFVRNKKTGRVLQTSLKAEYEDNKKGVWRQRVTISGVGTQKVSQIVAETFLGAKPDGKIVGHKNDIPIDNRVENLEYITQDENMTIDWVLREIGLRGLTTEYVDDVFEQIEEVLEDEYGVEVGVLPELSGEDAEEVKKYIDIYKRTVLDIYEYKVNGTGVLARLAVDDGKFVL